MENPEQLKWEVLGVWVSLMYICISGDDSGKDLPELAAIAKAETH